MQIRTRPSLPVSPRRQLTAARPLKARQAQPLAAPTQSAAFRRGVATIEATLAREARLKEGADASGLRLQPNYESIFMPQPSGQAKGTVVLYHGFSAGPWQYEELAKKFHQEGYHVYAPRIVGHGLMTPDGQVSTAELPRAHERQQYEDFIDERFAEAKALGAPVYMVGLSGGGNLALRTAEKHPEVKSVVAFAPYVGPGNALRFGTKILKFLNTITFGGVAKLLNHVPFGKNELPSLEDDSPHTRGSFDQAWSIRSIGYRLKDIAPPVQFLTTEGDFLSGAHPVRELIGRSGGDDDNGWYHFRKDEKVPHAMVSRLENPEDDTVDTLNRIAFEFIENGKQADRWP